MSKREHKYTLVAPLCHLNSLWAQDASYHEDRDRIEHRAAGDRQQQRSDDPRRQPVHHRSVRRQASETRRQHSSERRVLREERNGAK